MATRTELSGWNAEVMSRRTLDDDGETITVYTLVFVERGTGNVISFQHGEDVKDSIVRGYTGGVILGGSPPPG